MSDFERKDDLPSGADSPRPDGSEPADIDVGGDFEVVVSDDPPDDQTPVEGQDGVAGGDTEPTDGDDQPEEQRPRSRSARVRQRYREERDQAIAAAQALHQQWAQQQQQLAAAQQRAFMLEREAVENRFHYLQTVSERMTAEKRAAMDAGNSEAIAVLDQRMMHLAPELDRVARHRQQFAQFRPQQQMPAQQPVQQPVRQQQAPARLHEAAEKWANEQTGWLNADPARIVDARSVAQRLEAQGYQPDEPEYYERLNGALKAMHPDFRPVNPVRPGGATRSTGAAVAGVSRASSAPSRQTRQVTLTREDMAFCERNGIDPKSYAREKVAASAGGR